ncbi:MAG TPA: hypothetical protein VF152_04595 [Acidimicrobiia bacterium]
MAERKTRGADLVPLTGVLFVVLAVVGVFLGGEPPDADDPVREVVDYWADNEGAVILGSVLEGLAAVSLIFFAASLRRAIRRREGDAGVLSVAAMGGGIVAAAGIGVDAALRFTAADLAGEVRPVVIQTLNAIWADYFFPMVIGMAALVLATSLAALGTRVIPVWLAWIGFLICIALFTPAGFIAFLVSALWVLVVSVILWRQEATARTGPVGTTV